MKYALRELKGTHGYIRKQLIFEMIKTIILFVMALGIFFIGYYTLHTKKSLWSILAVLALLPASKSLVGVIMLARFKSLPNETYERYVKAIGPIPALYENILTTSDRSYFVPVICIASQSLAAFMPEGDAKALKAHLENVLRTAGHSVTVKVFDREDAFFERLSQLNEKAAEEGKTYESVFDFDIIFEI